MQWPAARAADTAAVQGIYIYSPTDRPDTQGWVRMFYTPPCSHQNLFQQELETKVREVFKITKKTPTRAFTKLGATM